ncbi:hypothetical protein MchiMG62_11770 [Methanoculleus chikugoensis]|uniref:Uncharacterized protein n=1 Tax=Methanoculleus chikugoensis TaxID=118126 RepID=A0ABN5XGT0_9EURY|nr:hypothetical protein MchiMG62_11770 [Methanoculleus chikugoensis]
MSVQPVNRFSLFQALSPCLSRINVAIVLFFRTRYGTHPDKTLAYAGRCPANDAATPKYGGTARPSPLGGIT